MEMAKINNLAREYEEARSLADELKAELEEANKQKASAELALINEILTVAEATGIDDLTATVDGRKYSVKTKDYYSIPKENRDEAFQLLRDLGHGDLITERVDDRTLTSEMATVREEYRSECPESEEDYPAEYEPLLAIMKVYNKPTLGRVKAK
jgi:hypothetical protein